LRKSIKLVIDKKISFNEKDIKEAINYVKTHWVSGEVVIEISQK